MRKDILKRENDIKQWISEGKSKAFICDQLDCKYDTLNIYLEKLNIPYKGNQGHNYTTGFKSSRYIPLLEYLKTSNPSRGAIKDKLFREGYKEYKCEICGAWKWNDCVLPLELHHKDGNTFNNVLENLQILCPNCHSVQEGYCGENIGRYSSEAPKIKKVFKIKARDSVRHNVRRKHFCENKNCERYNEKDKEIQRIRDIILYNSTIDFSKFGWITRLSEVPGINIPRHKITNWMKKYMPDFLETCYVYKRDRPHTYDK